MMIPCKMKKRIRIELLEKTKPNFRSIWSRLLISDNLSQFHFNTQKRIRWIDIKVLKWSREIKKGSSSAISASRKSWIPLKRPSAINETFQVLEAREFFWWKSSCSSSKLFCWNNLRIRTLRDSASTLIGGRVLDSSTNSFLCFSRGFQERPTVSGEFNSAFNCWICSSNRSSFSQRVLKRPW